MWRMGDVFRGWPRTIVDHPVIIVICYKCYKTSTNVIFPKTSWPFCFRGSPRESSRVSAAQDTAHVARLTCMMTAAQDTAHVAAGSAAQDTAQDTAHVAAGSAGQDTAHVVVGSEAHDTAHVAAGSAG